MTTFEVLDAGAEACGVLRVHHTALAPAARVDVMLGSDAQVPVTDPEPTAAPSVHAAVEPTGQATTSTAPASAAGLSDWGATEVDVVPARLPVFVRVTGFVIDRTESEKVTVIWSVPLIVAASLPIVVLDVAPALVVQSAQAALEPPTTRTVVSSSVTSTRTRRFTVPPASRSPSG